MQSEYHNLIQKSISFNNKSVPPEKERKKREKREKKERKKREKREKKERKKREKREKKERKNKCTCVKHRVQTLTFHFG